MTDDNTNIAALEALLQRFPEHSRDIRVNVQRVFTGSKLTAPRLWGAALASAVATRVPSLVEAVERDALSTGVSDDVLDDARAAASITSMNNIFYRFRHFMKDEAINQIPPRFQMRRAMGPKGDKSDFELFGLAVSAIHGCELCVRMHTEAAVRDGRSTEEVVESVRIAAVIHAAAVAMSQAS